MHPNECVVATYIEVGTDTTETVEAVVDGIDFNVAVGRVDNENVNILVDTTKSEHEKVVDFLTAAYEDF